MKKKCGYCFTRLDQASAVCRVCKIDPLKEKSALTREEKKIAGRCRTLYTVGFLSIIGSLMGLFLILPSAIFFLRGQDSKNVPKLTTLLCFYAATLMVLPFFGLALRRYKKWCYPGGIVLYSALIFVNLLDFNVAAIVVVSFFLYWIASPPSREILVF